MLTNDPLALLDFDLSKSLMLVCALADVFSDKKAIKNVANKTAKKERWDFMIEV